MISVELQRNAFVPEYTRNPFVAEYKRNPFVAEHKRNPFVAANKRNSFVAEYKKRCLLWAGIQNKSFCGGTQKDAWYYVGMGLVLIFVLLSVFALLLMLVRP